LSREPDYEEASRLRSEHVGTARHKARRISADVLQTAARLLERNESWTTPRAVRHGGGSHQRARSTRSFRWSSAATGPSHVPAGPSCSLRRIFLTVVADRN